MTVQFYQMVKIGLERIDTQEGVMVEALLDSRAMRLVMSSEFTRKQRFKLKKIKRLIYIRNIDRTFNKERSIKNTVEVNIYYQKYKEKTEINIIREQKQNVGSNGNQNKEKWDGKNKRKKRRRKKQEKNKKKKKTKGEKKDGSKKSSRRMGDLK